ncbi:SEC14-like protein 2 [Dirofilaria immitis]|nr:SEC14-like protein 2 [Dirofilaria immitis]
MKLNEISESDRALIEELRKAIRDELLLVPAYDDDFSLLRWIVGWDRKLGSLLGYDKQHNIISIQAVGRLDARSLLPCIRNSDLYILQIAETEGVMNLIRKNEKLLGRQLGTLIIFDLDGINLDKFSMPAMKMITTMLSQLQDMYPDVARKVFVINAPTFFRMIWGLISPHLSKHTQQKIEILGIDWKEKLKEYIDEDVLYEHWGGKRKAETPFGHIRMGGKVPESFRYDPSNDIPASKLEKLKISARSSNFVSVIMEGYNPNRKLSWWWRIESGDIDFSIIRSDNNSKNGNNNNHHYNDNDVVIWPKFRLQTPYVPESGKVLCTEPGVYKLVFDNKYSKFYNKVINYHFEILNN